MSRERLIYLDYAAATPMDERVVAAMQPYLSERFYNPSAAYLAASEVAQDLADARAKVAYWLGSRPSEMIFTAGGTEANNLVIQGVMRAHPKASLVVSAVEHESVLVPAAQFNYKIAPVDEQGVVDAANLAALIDDATVLVSIMYANNEVGTIEPIREVAQVLERVRADRRKAGNDLPLYFHTDAAQAANYLDLHTSRLGVDLMTLNGGKIYGPKQSGALFVKAGVDLQPIILGGGQERGMRSGTENIAAAVGFAVALELVQKDRNEEVRRLQKLQAHFFELLATKIPQAAVNGSRKKRLPNSVHITIPGSDNERLLIQLDVAGILAAAGSACSASSGEPSHVLSAMGRTDDEARASLRFSMGHGTTKAHIERAVRALSQFSN